MRVCVCMPFQHTVVMTEQIIFLLIAHGNKRATKKQVSCSNFSNDDALRKYMPLASLVEQHFSDSNFNFAYHSCTFELMEIYDVGRFF